jgi:hypothetical protein
VLAFPWPESDVVPAPQGFDGLATMHVAAGLVLDDAAAAARAETPGLPVQSPLFG